MKLMELFSKKDKCIFLKHLQEGQVEKYSFFRMLLGHNYRALNTIAELEQMYFSGKSFSLSNAMIKYQELSEAVIGIIHNMEKLSDIRFPALIERLQQIDEVILELLNPHFTHSSKALVIPFENITAEMSNMVGSKALNLALIKNTVGMPVPPGFVVTSYAFQNFLEGSGLARYIDETLGRIQSPDSVDAIAESGKKIKDMIMHSSLPSELSDAILKAYTSIEEQTYKGVYIAVRSSSIGEDTEASFAGQYSTVLNVSRENILEAYKKVLASKYSARAVAYRRTYGLDDRETPMCVIGLAMVNPISSGVLYTSGTARGESHMLKVSSIYGLGELLVSGDTIPDVFIIDKKSDSILEKHINRKQYQLINLPEGGTRREEISEDKQQSQSISDDTAFKLSSFGKSLEQFFGTPQDIEWALDKDGTLYVLQSRPLGISFAPEDETLPAELPDNQILLSGGEEASYGVAIGKAYIIKDAKDIRKIPDNAILVAKTASPLYAEAMGRISGLITEAGSVTSHLSSVAREFGVPALVAVENATTTILEGELITISTSTGTVYKGIVESFKQQPKKVKRLIIGSPVHQRMQKIIENISPLNLIDPEHPSFSPAGCKTIHDIIRFSHELSMREMFGLSEKVKDKDFSVKLDTSIPLNIYLIDLGGGLKDGLTTCDTIMPEHIESIPMQAIWKGFTHPGIKWSGAITFDAKKIMTLIASTATSEFGEMPGGTSYCLISKDYMNLSARFGYHFATIDTLCGEISDHNYISLQFAGGAGSYTGRSLRIIFLSGILQRLGFNITMKGDLLEASIMRYNRKSLGKTLDQVGRLFASSRLLDMAINSQAEAEMLMEKFFDEDYDFLNRKRDDSLQQFYIHGGTWKRVAEKERIMILQDGSKEGFTISSGLAGIIGKMAGQSLYEFLDTIEAYFYFPLAIVKNSEMSDGTISVRIKPESGNIDRAGGIAFAIKNISNYFVFRINALEDNAILFEYINGKRIQRVSATMPIKSHKWYHLKVVVFGSVIKGFIDDEFILEYISDETLDGYIGLWTKADSVTYFEGLKTESNSKSKIFEF